MSKINLLFLIISIIIITIIVLLASPVSAQCLLQRESDYNTTTNTSNATKVIKIDAFTSVIVPIEFSAQNESALRKSFEINSQEVEQIVAASAKNYNCEYAIVIIFIILAFIPLNGPKSMQFFFYIFIALLLASPSSAQPFPQALPDLLHKHEYSITFFICTNYGFMSAFRVQHYLALGIPISALSDNGAAPPNRRLRYEPITHITFQLRPLAQIVEIDGGSGGGGGLNHVKLRCTIVTRLPFRSLHHRRYVNGAWHYWPPMSEWPTSFLDTMMNDDYHHVHGPLALPGVPVFFPFGWPHAVLQHQRYRLFKLGNGGRTQLIVGDLLRVYTMAELHQLFGWLIPHFGAVPAAGVIPALLPFIPPPDPSTAAANARAVGVAASFAPGAAIPGGGGVVGPAGNLPGWRTYCQLSTIITTVLKKREQRSSVNLKSSALSMMKKTSLLF